MIFFIQAEFLTNSHTGQEITVQFVLDPDYGQVSNDFKVGEKHIFVVGKILLIFRNPNSATFSLQNPLRIGRRRKCNIFLL